MSLWELAELQDVFGDVFPPMVYPNGYEDCGGFREKALEWMGLADSKQMVIATRIGRIENGDTTWARGFSYWSDGTPTQGGIVDSILGTTQAGLTTHHEGGHGHLDCQDCGAQINAITQECWDEFGGHYFLMPLAAPELPRPDTARTTEQGIERTRQAPKEASHDPSS